MARVFKLVKSYPGSPEVGTLVRFTGDKYKVEGSNKVIAEDLVENHPEYWHEVSEPLFETSDNVYIFKPGDIVFVVDKSNWTTTPVKANQVVDKAYLKKRVAIFANRDRANIYVEANVPKYSNKELLEFVDKAIEGIIVTVEGGVAYCNDERVMIIDNDNLKN